MSLTDGAVRDWAATAWACSGRGIDQHVKHPAGTPEHALEQCAWGALGAARESAWLVYDSARGDRLRAYDLLVRATADAVAAYDLSVALIPDRVAAVYATPAAT